MEKTNAKKYNILVADDDPSILDVVKIVLEEEGYIVETTLDGNVIPKIHNKMPDLLLLDIWMSGQDGRDICKQIKSDSMISSLPVILFSANKNIENIALQYKAQDYLSKPFEIQELIRKVENVLKHKNLSHS